MQILEKWWPWTGGAALDTEVEARMRRQREERWDEEH
jgi:hypothetical protein